MGCCSVAILIHVNPQGIMQGNGGYVGLISTLEEFRRMGHRDTYLLDVGKTDDPSRLIEVAPGAEYLCSDDTLVWGPHHAREPMLLLSLWMDTALWRCITSRGWEDAFAFWDMGQLLREKYLEENRRVRALLAYNGKPLLVLNRHLIPFYQERLGYPRVEALDGWARTDFFYDHNDERPVLVGYQDEVRHRELSRRSGERMACYLKDVLERYAQQTDASLLCCEGTHHEVGDKMRQCRYFVWFNVRDANASLFKGETLGYALIEALVSGCIVVAKRNYFTQVLLPDILLADTLQEAISVVDYLRQEPDEAEHCRQACQEAGRQYTFDWRRKSALRQAITMGSLEL